LKAWSGKAYSKMRLLNVLVHNLPDALLWLRSPQGLSEGLSKRQLPLSVCSTTTTVFLPAGTIISNATATYVNGQGPLACTTTISVSPSSTLTTVNSLTSTYSGPPGNQTSGLPGNQTSGLPGNQTSGLPGNQTSGVVRQLFSFLYAQNCAQGMWGIMCSLESCLAKGICSWTRWAPREQAHLYYSRDAVLVPYYSYFRFFSFFSIDSVCTVC
jgi:hypothetical protein